MPTPVALITGASSGIGLALTKHLISKSWHVIMADINPPKETLSSTSTSFHRTDVSSWDSQASTFKACFEKHGRLDFCALNAGIDDRDDVFGVPSEAGQEPKKPDMKTFDVNLFGPYFGLKLAAHYMAKNSGNDGLRKSSGGRIVMTASDAGFHALHVVPQYTATKHGVVGLTRSIAVSAKEAGFTVNAVAPALVPTGLAPEGLLDSMPKDNLTPMDTVIKAFDALGLFDKVGEEGWGAMGPNGAVVEARGNDIHWREEVQRVGGVAKMPEGVEKSWEHAYKERNRKFAMRQRDD